MQTDQNRIRKIMEMREQGKTYRKIADVFGVTCERIRQLYYREIWRREQNTKPKE